MTEQQIPKNEYEMVEGTEPRPYVEHEPRTLVHTRTNSDNDLVSMMTEIGDGTFVQWTHCRKCKSGVENCSCPDGPVSADYIDRWREKRFSASLLTQRPDPAFDLIPSLLDWVRERGFMVVDPKVTVGVLRAAQEAADMAYGDSNDDEIDGLRTALEEALLALGLEMPDGVDPDDEIDDEIAGEEVAGASTFVPPGSTEVAVDDLTGKMAEMVEQVVDEAAEEPARNLDDIPDDF